MMFEWIRLVFARANHQPFALAKHFTAKGCNYGQSPRRFFHKALWNIFIRFSMIEVGIEYKIFKIHNHVQYVVRKEAPL